MTIKNNCVSYEDAGVSIEAGNALVEQIKPLAKSTQRPGAIGGIGGFGALFDLKAAGYKDPILVSSTDGVGTKLKLAIDAGKHETIGIDLVAMCVNDLVVQGAEPLFFLDYFATSKLTAGRDENILKGIAEGCRQAGCVLAGGETAEMPGMYAKGDYDLAGFAVGAVERNQILPAASIQEGDLLLGLASSGVHSNGYSLVRRILEKQNLKWDSPLPFIPEKMVADVFLAPTRIYVKSCLAAIRSGGVKALAHITGGGLTENIPRVLPKTLAAEISWSSWQRPAVFNWLQEAGPVELTEMQRTFNCGIGMVLVVDASRVKTLAKLLDQQGEIVHTIGQIVKRSTQAVSYK